MEIIYLEKETIININFQTINLHGGDFLPPSNLNNPESFEYLIEIVKDDFYYPTIFDKAAAYTFNTSSRHIFSDGNKRTGLQSAFLFLAQNFYVPKYTLTSKEIIKIGIEIADSSNQITVEDVAEWYRGNFEIEGIRF